MVVAWIAVTSVVSDAHAQRDPRPNETRTMQAGMFVRQSFVTDVGINRGALQMPRLDFGLRFRSRTGHLGFDVGAGLGIGAYRAEVDRTIATMEIGFLMDMRVYLNPKSRAQLFGLAGASFGMGGPFQHLSVPGVDDTEECPGLTHLEGSFGMGTEIRLGRGAISFMLRAVRRQAITTLGYVSARENVSDPTSRSMWGLSAGVQLTAYLDAPDRS